MVAQKYVQFVVAYYNSIDPLGITRWSRKQCVRKLDCEKCRLCCRRDGVNIFRSKDVNERRNVESQGVYTDQ